MNIVRKRQIDEQTYKYDDCLKKDRAIQTYKQETRYVGRQVGIQVQVYKHESRWRIDTETKIDRQAVARYNQVSRSSKNGTKPHTTIIERYKLLQN